MKRITALMAAMLVVMGLCGCGSVSTNPSAATESQQSGASVAPRSEESVEETSETEKPDTSEESFTDSDGNSWDVRVIPANWKPEHSDKYGSLSWEERILNLYWLSSDRFGDKLAMEVEATNVSDSSARLGRSSFLVYQNDEPLEFVQHSGDIDNLESVLEPLDIEHINNDFDYTRGPDDSKNRGKEVRAGATKNFLFYYTLATDDPVEIVWEDTSQTFELTPDSVNSKSAREYRDVEGKKFTLDGLRYQVTGVYNEADFAVFRVNVVNEDDEPQFVRWVLPQMFQNDVELDRNSEACHENLTDIEDKQYSRTIRVDPDETRELVYCVAIDSNDPIDITFSDTFDTIYDETFSLD